MLPEAEADLNAWYDQEHLPGLAAVPGTVRALRYECRHKGPRYLACYDLHTRETFGSPPWLAVRHGLEQPSAAVVPQHAAHDVRPDPVGGAGCGHQTLAAGQQSPDSNHRTAITGQQSPGCSHGANYRAAPATKGRTPRGVRFCPRPGGYCPQAY